MSASFSPSPQELVIVSQIFAQVDPNKLGVITGDAGLKLFARTNLSPSVLGEIWEIADTDNKGWLSKKGLAIALRLIAWSQKGEKLSLDCLNKPGPLPTIEGITTVAQQPTGVSLPRSPPPGFPPLSPQDKAKFQRLFASCNPVNGFLSADKARDVFLKSKLSVEQLSQIWNLADTQDRGLLDVVDFTIGMYLIQATMSGHLSFIPNSLPLGLYEQAGGIPHAKVPVQTTGTSGSFSPTSFTFPFQRTNIPTQYSGQRDSQLIPRSPFRAGSTSLGSSAFSSISSSNGYAIPWDVTQAEKAVCDQFFDKLDALKKGYIEGHIAVPFMLDSKLPSEDLATIWDLADINAEGHLTRDTFAVAMHLISARCAGKEIPAVLPPSLIPPSVRSGVPSSPPRAEPQVDLFSWDDTPPTSATQQPVAVALPKQSTSGTPLFASFSKASTLNDPFAPSTSLLNLQKHLLDDDETPTHAPPPLQDQSAQIGNMKNQLTSTNRSLEATKLERVSTEQNLASQAAQLSALETQLSSAKAAYETETKLLATLRERWTNQNAEIQKAREDLIRAESDLSAVRVEKAEVEGNLLRDKEEARELHRKMFEAAQLTDVAKSEVEKLKKEAKQQKGLLAIARKQLSVKEVEHAKMTKELEETKAEHQTIVSERESVETKLDNLASAPPTLPQAKADEVPRSDSADTIAIAARQALPNTPTPSSPASGVVNLAKSNNPFERLAMSSGRSTPIAQSPFLPFANSSVPTPPTPPQTQTDTAKSNASIEFDQVFNVEKPVANVSKVQQNGSGTPSTPKPATVDTLPEINPLSPATDAEYATPPTSSGAYASPTQEAATLFPDIDGPASKFPPLQLEEPADLVNSEGQKSQDDETALAARHMEMNADESDSDSDEDDVHLGELATKSTDKQTKPVGAPVPRPGSTFDDLFKEPLTAPPQHDVPVVPVNSAAAMDPFDLANQTQPSDDAVSKTTESAPQVSTSGVIAFDEAMRKISDNGAGSQPPRAYTFDTAFDSDFEDNFDFAKATSAADVPSKSPPADANVNKANASSVPMQRQVFDDIFGIPPAAAAGTARPPTLPTIETSAPLSIFTPNGFVQSPATHDNQMSSNNAVSFEERAVDVQPAKLLEYNASLSSKASTSPVRPDTAASQASPETSPSASRFSSNRPVSPPPPSQPESSKPSSTSPKGRPSISGKDAPRDKSKEAPPRHSKKLSIRLPFGRKNKKQQQEAPPPLPSPVQPQDYLNTTGPDEDVEAVKQLCGMGFSREDAIAALERNGYNLNQALNNLLGPDRRPST